MLQIDAYPKRYLVVGIINLQWNGKNLAFL